MTYHGRVQNGQIVLDEAASLPEGAAVRVEVIDGVPSEQTIWEKLLELAGTVEGLPADLAENHDHYLYGSPKR
jgi:hypothetical protein